MKKRLIPKYNIHWYLWQKAFLILYEFQGGIRIKRREYTGESRNLRQRNQQVKF